MPEALATGSADFSKSFPDSLSGSVMPTSPMPMRCFEEGRAPEAAALLEKDRAPIRSDIELAIGRAYEAAGDNQKAASAFRNLYFNLPTSFEADVAGTELGKLGIAGSLAERRTRADLLLKAKHYSDAAHDYRELLNANNNEGQLAPAERPKLQVALASALEKTNDKEARQILTSMGSQTGDAEAERLYLLSETARSSSDEEAVQRNLNQLRQFGPTSPWLEQALLSAGNMYLLKRDYDHAIDYFRELQQRFPNGARALLCPLEGRVAELPSGSHRRRADKNSKSRSRSILIPRKFLTPCTGAPVSRKKRTIRRWPARFIRNSPIAFATITTRSSARQRLKALPGEPPPRKIRSTTLCSIVLRRSQPPGKLLPVILPTITCGSPGRVCSRMGAWQIWQYASCRPPPARWSEPGRRRRWLDVYQDGGRYDRGIEIMKRTTPNYFAVDLPDLPRPYWEALFPKAYWTDLRKYSVLNGLDPYLVASLIRQESEFNAQALSRANAVGLMQLLPEYREDGRQASQAQGL